MMSEIGALDLRNLNPAPGVIEWFMTLLTRKGTFSQFNVLEAAVTRIFFITS
jgi:hypothetical protein